MATRVPEPEPWCRVSAVLARAAGVDESRSFDAAAEAQARTMRGVRRDWDNRPCITWSMAAELLASLRAEQARVVAEIEDKAIEAHRQFLANLPPGLSAEQVPAGVTAGQLMMLSDPEFQVGRRRSVVQDALANDGGLVYHSVGGES
jgi:hypothetical protein